METEQIEQTVELSEEKEYKEKVSEYRKLSESEDDCRWKKGDLAIDIEINYGQKNLQRFSKDVGEEYNTMRVYRKVSGIFRNDKRLSNLSWTHHFIACFSDEPSEWIIKAEKENLSTRQLKNAIKKEKEGISETAREVTSLSINRKIFEDFKDYCRKKGVVMSYLIENIMKEILLNPENDEINIKIR